MNLTDGRTDERRLAFLELRVGAKNSFSLFLQAIYVTGHVGSFFNAEASQVLNSRREGSGHKRSIRISFDEERIKDEEELEVALQRIAASVLFEITSDLSKEDQGELTIAEGRSYSRTKRGIFLKKALLLKKLMAAVVVADKKRGQVEKYSGIKAGIKVVEKIRNALK